MPGGLRPRRAWETRLSHRVVEKLDVISRSDPDLVIGRPVPIDIVHREGRVHRGSWMFAIDSHLSMLLAWRARSMRTCPQSWSCIGEHAIVNETFTDAARRGVSEETRFLVRPRFVQLGRPFFYHYVYANGTAEARTDNQWTQAYVVLPRGDALDFRALDDDLAQERISDGENTLYQGMSLSNVARHALRNPPYFCHEVQAQWMLRALPLIVRVLSETHKRKFRRYISEDWDRLVEAGAPLCCAESETLKPVDEVDITLCGVPCNKSKETAPSANSSVS